MSYMDSDEEASPEMLMQYRRAVEMAQKEDLSAFDRSGLIQSLGKNKDNEEVLLITFCFLTGAADELEKAMHYALAKLHEMENQPFAVIFALAMTNWLNDAVSVLKQCYLSLPRSIKKNLKKIYLLHWTLARKMVLDAMSNVVSEKFWKKIVYVEQLSDILSTLQMPPIEALTKIPYVVQHEEEERVSPGSALTIYGTPVATLCARIPTNIVPPYTRLPRIYVDFVDHITSREVIGTKDLFCLQADCASIYAFVGDIDQGNPFAEWTNIPALITGFRLLFDCLTIPFLGEGAYGTFSALTKAATAPDKTKLLDTVMQVYSSLSPGEQEACSYIMKAFKVISGESSQNAMTPLRIAEVFAPSFCRPPTKPDSQAPIVTQMIVQAISLAIENAEKLTPNAQPKAVQPAAAAPAGKAAPKKKRAESSSSESSSSSSDEESSSSEGSSDEAQKKANGTKPAAPATVPARPPAAPAATGEPETATAPAAPKAAAPKQQINRQASAGKRPSSSSSSEESSDDDTSSEEEDDD
ncbi:putative rhoGAP protein [Neospora caninum Liverpool]|uniref:Putative rhoGAP protein n=1 Tax=Neospora caninum (strain Liverpool) TaxID=572307 RepID=F0VIG0_NEOCL|nr:putative rhoGAP protein [Neospora caninum Liverpool]CBZ53521.1 putative rhoGAP protein [Neospora caninum Liverpool]CEL67510.1 TPA: rhoGAP protein, putative [Neospora caninum Liverpool]|eukprot:XP_003883553.1 putative rhoGAP protein [Neospora caninum Liverpool]